MSVQPPPGLPPKPEAALPPHPPQHLPSPTTPIRSERDRHYAPSSSSRRGAYNDRDDRTYRGPPDMDSYRPYHGRAGYDYDRDSRPYYDDRDRDRNYRGGDRDRDFRRDSYYPPGRPPYDDRRFYGRYRGRSRSRSPPPRRRRRSSSRGYERSLSPRSIDSRRRSRSPPSRRGYSPPRYGRVGRRQSPGRSRTPPSRSKHASPDRRGSPSPSGTSEDGEEGEVVSSSHRKSRSRREEHRLRSRTRSRSPPRKEPTPSQATPSQVASSQTVESTSKIPTVPPAPPKAESVDETRSMDLKVDVITPQHDKLQPSQAWTPLSSNKGKQKEEPNISQLTEVHDVKMEDGTACSPVYQSPAITPQHRLPTQPRHHAEAGPSTLRQDHLHQPPPRPPSSAPTGPRIRTSMPLAMHRTASSSGARSPMPVPSPVPSVRPLQSNAAASSSSSPRGIDMIKSVSAGTSPIVTSKPLPSSRLDGSTIPSPSISAAQRADDEFMKDILQCIPEWKEDWTPWQPPSKTAVVSDWSCAQFRRRIADSHERVEALEKDARKAKLQYELSAIDLRAAELVRLAAERHLEQAKFGFLDRPGTNDGVSEKSRMVA